MAAEYEILIVENREYVLNERPSAADVLVLQKQKEILGNLRLDTVINNLDLCVDMYRLAYIGATAANAGVVKSKVIDLQSEFGKICVLANETMLTLKDSCQQTLKLLDAAYAYLIQGSDGVALAKLARCADQAKRMSAAAAKLSDQFLDLQGKSAEAKSEAALAHASEEEKRRHAHQEMVKLNAELKGCETSIGNLVKELESVNADQAKAEKELSADKKRGFVLGIISLVSGVAAAGLQTYAQTRNPLSVLVAQNQTGTLDAELKQITEKWEAAKKERDDVNKKLSDLTRKLDCAKETIALSQKEVDDLKAQPDSEAAQEEDGAAKRISRDKSIADKQAIIQAETKNVAQFEADIKDLKAQSAAAGETYAALGASARKLAEGTDNMAKQSFSAADQSQSKLEKIIDIKRQVNQERNDLEIKMGGMVGQLAATQVVGANAEIAVKALQVAMFAISQVIVALNDAAMFWRQISTACENLRQDSMDKQVIDLESLSKEERIAEYKSQVFMLSYLEHICSWAALHEIAHQYTISVEQSRTLNNQHISHSIDDPEQAAKIVSTLAKSINDKIMLQATQSLAVLEA
jgi:septal ring factor EnvC (AmiA/AmiB activator)